MNNNGTDNAQPQVAMSEELQQTLLAHSNSDTGYFVYDLDHLSAHLAKLADQDVVKLWYAVKANPLSSIIGQIKQAGIHFDVASKGELSHVLAQGAEPENILNTGPAKSKQQMGEFLEQGVTTFVIESVLQLAWLNEQAEEKGMRPRVLLRVQLQWSEGEKNPLGGNSITPFGLGCEQWQEIVLSDYPALDVCGLHIFQWGNMLSNEKMFALWQQMVPPLLSLASQLKLSLEVLDLGGGLGVDYLGQGQTICWQQAMDHLAEIKEMAGVEELWLELGRYAVADCGYYVTTVVDKKSNFDKKQIVLSAGINHLMRPAITEQPFPAKLLRPSDEKVTACHLHGPLCTSLDALGVHQLPEDTQIGDHIIFGLAGAYGFTESMPFFLCHEVAAEYSYSHGELIEVREQQAASWYLR